MGRDLRALPPPCRRLADALARMGVGDTVATMLPNVPAMLEAHFGVPGSGAVLNTLNTRLDATAIAFALDHTGAKVLQSNREFCRPQLTRFKLPKRIVFGELPKTSTGRIQKFLLRDRMRSAAAIG